MRRRRAYPVPKLDTESDIGQDYCPIEDEPRRRVEEHRLKNSGTDRGDREVILGSAPSEHLEALPVLSFAPLRFDAREFMHFVENENLTEAEAVAVLRAIWEVAVACVDLRFGISRIQHLVDRSSGSEGSGDPGVLSSPSSTEKPKQETVARAFRAAVVKEDS